MTTKIYIVSTFNDLFHLEGKNLPKLDLLTYNLDLHEYACAKGLQCGYLSSRINLRFKIANHFLIILKLLINISKRHWKSKRIEVGVFSRYSNDPVFAGLFVSSPLIHQVTIYDTVNFDTSSFIQRHYFKAFFLSLVSFFSVTSFYYMGSSISMPSKLFVRVLSPHFITVYHSKELMNKISGSNLPTSYDLHFYLQPIWISRKVSKSIYENFLAKLELEMRALGLSIGFKLHPRMGKDSLNIRALSIIKDSSPGEKIQPKLAKMSIGSQVIWHYEGVSISLINLLQFNSIETRATLIEHIKKNATNSPIFVADWQELKDVLSCLVLKSSDPRK